MRPLYIIEIIFVDIKSIYLTTSFTCPTTYLFIIYFTYKPYLHRTAIIATSSVIPGSPAKY